MIEIGTVKTVDPAKGTILVEFAQMGTEANCAVVVATTGANNVFHLPSVGTQVVCWLEGGKNIVLGSLYSEAEPTPADVDENTEIRQFGKTVGTTKADLWRVAQDKVIIELTGNKASLKNDSTGFKTILKDILTAIKTLTVSTGVGPSGTPLPPTIQKITELEQKTDQLFND